ncbi:S-adenosylmethionine decarboxylase [Psychromonas sp. MB-3u-54]|uniref:S-adenosylmethionine decarboxylase n=1 Tax=Psychromonas sp. MB-3u-54 TaxID=2058319 RepID=UPI000C31BA8E|nr:S-adenosylmethionine decarboxylase [Psychromonas sp. MB-3u-54]PKH01644.1 S-adenosylmethionine decarboxylase [Psychromonas sp. MB-3u-54]
MFYEGTEKRLEIITTEMDLLQLPEAFWQQMVEQADAFIISKIENIQLKAYLLSESSLFVWHNKLLLITCGNTHLVKAAQFFQKQFDKRVIQSLLFHRHQAQLPDLQKSSFAQDTVLLKTHLQGETKHWQGNYRGDLFLFGESPTGAVKTKQILMLHGLCGNFACSLQSGSVSQQLIASRLAVLRFFPCLQTDQFTFSPKGYSLNALAGEQYLTLHITPEKLSTYLSVESSFEAQVMQPFNEHLHALFRPQQSHLMSFIDHPDQGLEITVSSVM